MRPFRRASGPVFVARLDPTERAVLLDAVDGVLGLLGAVPAPPPEGPWPGGDAPDGDPGGDAPPWPELGVPGLDPAPPLDPALRRLLPDASDDPAVAAELRRLTEGDLRRRKHSQLRRLRDVLDAARPDAVVAASEAPGVAAALTDVRLVMAERLGLRTDADAAAVDELAMRQDPPADEDDATRRLVAAVYTVLTDLQESLVRHLAADLPPAGRVRGSH